MSQEKVDRYKKEKANRKQIMKREKRLLNLEKAFFNSKLLHNESSFV